MAQSPAMQALAAHGPPRRRYRGLVVAAVVVALAAAGGGYALASRGSPSSGGTAGTNGGRAGSGGTTGTTRATPFALASSTPANGATGVASDSTVSLTFTSPVSLGKVTPTLSPTVAGTWHQTGPATIAFEPSAPLTPGSTVAVTVPDGPGGLEGASGGQLTQATSVGFTVATGSTTRLQELLATLNYLPLSFVPSGPAPAPNEMAMPQPGALNWRWAGLPPDLTTQWIQGDYDVITKAAVMTFQNQNGLTVDGLAGPQVWSTLLANVAANKVNSAPWDYVLVNKTLPQTLTLYENGNPVYTNIPVNTGAPGADTTDGTYPVFEHVTASRMVGTNPDGTTYDDPNVPWASFFNGGDALHGFVRATYGSPQSNGCVEMTVANAQMLWPLTPVGTLVTVIGPPS